MKEHKYPEIINITQQMLSIDYTSMMAHKILQQTYKIRGDTNNREKYHTIEFGLLKSILQTGDGKTCETGWHVIQVAEEYFILDMLDAQLTQQSLINLGGTCDKMDVTQDGGNTTYYFDVSLVFEGYKEEMGK